MDEKTHREVSRAGGMKVLKKYGRKYFKELSGKAAAKRTAEAKERHKLQ